MPQMVDRAQKRVKEIAALVKNDRAQAERLIRTAIEREPQFFRDLVEPFLTGIIAHALSGGDVAKPGTSTVLSKAPPQAIPATGMDSLLKTMSSNLSAPAEAVPHTPDKVSSGHADTIRALAEAQKARKQREG